MGCRDKPGNDIKRMTASTIQDSPYAWFRLAVSLALATIGGIGIWSGIVVLPFIQIEFGVDRSGASFPYTMSMIGFALGGLLMGRLADRFGIMVPMFLGSIMLGLGFVTSALAPTYYIYVASQAVLIGLGCATIFGPLVADVSLWFQKRRGIAVAVAASGNYIAGTIWPPFLTWGIQTYGWRYAYIALGILTVSLMLPLSLFLRRRASLDERPSPSIAARSGGKTLDGTPGAARPAHSRRPCLLRGHVHAPGPHHRLLRRPGLRPGPRR